MPRVLCLPLLLFLLALPLAASAPPASGGDAGAATVTASAKKKKKLSVKKKRAICKRKAKKIRNRRKRAAAMRRCNKIGRRKRRPVAKPPVPVPAPPAVAPRVEGGADDAVVIAVLDSGVNPYHHDFAAAKMPQHLDGVAGNDLPLDRPATEWLPGLAGTNPGWASFDRLDIPLSNDPEETATALEGAGNKLENLKVSTPEKVQAYWIPGTKVIGAVNFSDDGALWRGTGAHGVGTTSSAVGNLHGTCPECLLFFVDYGDSAEEGEAAIDWVMKQPWVDAITNSYGFALAYRDRVYSGSNTELQRQASERGQTVFFSAGNGNDGAFTVPNTTEFSSQEGPDWIVTVGAVSPGADNYYGNTSGESGNGSYVGAGKPSDIAGIGSDYPTAYTADAIGATGQSGFGGTSNATPQVAGLYGRALYEARTALAGPSRTQGGGVVATGDPFACGVARPDCELADGRLTGAELRTRLLHGAVHSTAGMAVYTAGAGDDPEISPVGEEEFLNEGHGTYRGREQTDRGAWLTEFDRLFGPIVGRGRALERPPGELEWMIVDSYCRQKNWGSWPLGYYVEGQTTLPGPDPDWPMRSSREQTCPGGGA